MAKRLTDKHPAKQKFDKFCELAAEMNISIEFLGHRTFVVIDGDRFDLEDAESGESLQDFPPTFEYKLIIDR